MSSSQGKMKAGINKRAKTVLQSNQNRGQKLPDPAADLLEKVRRQHYQTQVKFAAKVASCKVRCSQGAVARWEDGSRTVPVASLLPLAFAMRCLTEPRVKAFITLWALANQLRQLELYERVKGRRKKAGRAQQAALRAAMIEPARFLEGELVDPDSGRLLAQGRQPAR